MPKTALPPAELDTIPQFAARTNTSVRNIYRAIEDDRITLVYVGNVARIDPVPNMARIRRERPPARRSAAGRARMQHRDLSPAAGAAHSFRAAARKARTRCPQGEAVIELRPYQEDCVRRMRDALARTITRERNGRVMPANPSGSGKTITFAWLAMPVAAHGSRILILAHRQEINGQISDTMSVPGHPPEFKQRWEANMAPAQSFSSNSHENAANMHIPLKYGECYKTTSTRVRA